MRASPHCGDGSCARRALGLNERSALLKLDRPQARGEATNPNVLNDVETLAGGQSGCARQLLGGGGDTPPIVADGMRSLWVLAVEQRRAELETELATAHDRN